MKNERWKMENNPFKSDLLLGSLTRYQSDGSIGLTETAA
jgi:hypothetical protein